MRKSIHILVTLLILVYASPSMANGFCSTESMAGRWAFATDLGHLVQPDGSVIPATAVGIFTLDKEGNFEGVFDVTLQGLAYVPDIGWWGTMQVGPDCRGTASFETASGSTRTDSFVLVSQWEALGMTQSPSEPWTYTMRKLPGLSGDKD